MTCISGSDDEEEEVDFNSDWKDPDEDVEKEEIAGTSLGYTVVDAILADGLFAKPILNFQGLKLDLERRDPQGRTLLLAACRSALGADAIMDSSLCDVSINPHFGEYHRNPFTDNRPIPDKSRCRCPSDGQPPLKDWMRRRKGGVGGNRAIVGGSHC